MNELLEIFLGHPAGPFLVRVSPSWSRALDKSDLVLLMMGEPLPGKLETSAKASIAFVQAFEL